MRLLVFQLNPMEYIKVGFEYCIVLSVSDWAFVSYYFIYSLVMWIILLRSGNQLVLLFEVDATMTLFSRDLAV